MQQSIGTNNKQQQTSPQHAHLPLTLLNVTASPGFSSASCSSMSSIHSVIGSTYLHKDPQTVIDPPSQLPPIHLSLNPLPSSITHSSSQSMHLPSVRAQRANSGNSMQSERGSGNELAVGRQLVGKHAGLALWRLTRSIFIYVFKDLP